MFKSHHQLQMKKSGYPLFFILIKTFLLIYAVSPRACARKIPVLRYGRTRRAQGIHTAAEIRRQDFYLAVVVICRQRYYHRRLLVICGVLRQRTAVSSCYLGSERVVCCRFVGQHKRRLTAYHYGRFRLSGAGDLYFYRLICCRYLDRHRLAFLARRH